MKRVSHFLRYKLFYPFAFMDLALYSFMFAASVLILFKITCLYHKSLLTYDMSFEMISLVSFIISIIFSVFYILFNLKKYREKRFADNIL